MIVATTPPLLVSALSVAMADNLGLSVSDLGVGISLSYLTSAILSPAAGRIVHRLGSTRSIRWICMLTCLGLLLIAVARSVSMVMTALIVFGLPNAMIQPASNRVLAAVANPKSRALLFGIVQSSIPAATMLSGLLLVAFGDGDSWRDGFWCAIVLTLGALILVGIAPTTSRTRRPDSALGAVTPAALPAVKGAALLPALIVGAFFGSAAATTLAIFGAAGGAAAGLSSTAAATGQVVGSLCCIAMRTVVAWRSAAQGGPRQLARVAVLLAVGTAGFALLALSHTDAFLVGMAIAYAFGWGWTGLFNLAIASVRPAQVARVTGLTQGGFFLGAVAGPLTFAVLTQAHGFYAGWIASTMAGAAGAAAITLAAFCWGRAWRRSVSHEPR